MSLNENLGRRKNKIPHLIIEARAGTGKTTTLVEGLKLVTGKGIVDITPSPQQEAIWKAMSKSEGLAKSICFAAFNKSIATELQERVPEGCDAMTMHSMGFRSVRRAFDNVQVNQYRVQDIVAELLGKEIQEIRRKDFELLKATEKLVGLCKMNLMGWEWPQEQIVPPAAIEDELANLASHYDVELNGNRSRVFDLVPRVLERCKDITHECPECRGVGGYCEDGRNGMAGTVTTLCETCKGSSGYIDFNDMIWLPVVLDLNVFRYDLLLVDEAQDLNRCQQQLALKAGRRLILCGDPKQAIYGFAGADSKSIDNMMRELSITDVGCEYLQLTVTRRCGKAIVKEAKKIVPDFEAHRSCCDGSVFRLSMESDPNSECEHSFNAVNVCQLCGYTTGYRSAVSDCGGDMILCRVNAPLVSECFKFLRLGRKANIQGRDVGQGLISTIRKLVKIHDIDTTSREGTSLFSLSLHSWLSDETEKERRKKNPSDSRIIALQDRYDCICCFSEGEKTVENVIKRIESIFTDNKNGVGIMLSSVHKAKGLESKRVFILQPEGAEMPHPMAKSEWQIEQEYNLKYVAITRAIQELIYVT